MKVLLQHIRDYSQQTPKTILFIGAGNGSSLSALRDLNPRKLILTEAHPRLAETLEKKIRMDAGETLWQGAIIPLPQMNRTTLRVLNNPSYSSVAAPTQLLQYLPNLRETGQVEVPAQNLCSLVEPLNLNAEDCNILVLEAPGQTLALLQATPPVVLHQFQWVIVSTSPEALHENDATQEELLTALDDIGFDTPIESANALYPYNRYLITRNDERLRQRQMDEALETLTRERDELGKKLKEINATLIAQTKELDAAKAQAASLQADLTKKDGEVVKAQTEIAELRKQQEAIKKTLAERDVAMATAIKQAEEQAKQLATTQQQLKDASTKQATQAKEMDAAKAQMASLQADLAKKDEAAKAQSEIAELRKQQEATEKTLAERDATLANVNKQAEEQAKRLTAAQQQLKDANTKRATQAQRLDAAKAQAASLQADLAKKNDEALKAQAETKKNDLRQRLFQEELVKAEAQIELIKELLLDKPEA